MKKLIGFLFAVASASSFAKTLNFLSLSDLHLNMESAHKMQIDPKGYRVANDLDLGTFTTLLSELKKNTGSNKLVPQPAFILLLGDLVGHRFFVFGGRKKFVLKNRQEVFRKIKDTYPRTPIFYVFGNNDSPQTNYGDFSSKEGSPVATTAHNAFLSTGALCKSGDAMPCLEQQNTELGFYSAKLAKNMELVALNSVMFSSLHDAKTTETEAQFSFLKQQLTKAQKNKTHVLIAMHIPVGNNLYDGKTFWKAQYEKEFLNILNDHSSAVEGILVGHTHMEQFQPVRLKTKTLGQYYTAGLSTSHGNSPSVKSFKLMKGHLANTTAYGFHKKDGKIHLTQSYRFFQRYCPIGQTPPNINLCLDKVRFKAMYPRLTENNPHYKKYKMSSPQAFVVEQKQ